MIHQKKIIAIWAQDENGLIGVNQTMPWHLPKELKHFKEQTTGQAIVMGRVTFDGMKRRSLPNRQTLILSRTKQMNQKNVQYFSSREEILDWFSRQEKNLFIIGGAAVYETFADDYDVLLKTVVHSQFEGDTYFPDLHWQDYELTSSVFHGKDEKNSYDFTVYTYEKREN